MGYLHATIATYKVVEKAIADDEFMRAIDTLEGIDNLDMKNKNHVAILASLYQGYRLARKEFKK